MRLIIYFLHEDILGNNKGDFAGFTNTGTTIPFSTFTPTTSRGTNTNADMDIDRESPPSPTYTTDIAPPAPSALPTSPVATNIAPLQPPPCLMHIDNGHQFLDSNIGNELFTSASNSQTMELDELASVLHVGSHAPLYTHSQFIRKITL